MISLFSLIFFLVLAEFGLRVVAYLAYASEFGIQSPTIHGVKPKTGSNVQTVLCIGDSYTWGGSGERDQTYPAYLYHELQERDPTHDYVVINRGICESNTTRHVQKISRWLDEFSPDTVVLLNGSANRFNPWDYKLWAKKTAFATVRSWFAHLRIVKVFRTLYVNGVGRKLLSTIIPSLNRFAMWEIEKNNWASGREGSPDCDKLCMFWHQYNNGNSADALRIGRAALERNVNDEKMALSLAYFYMEEGEVEKAETMMESLLLRSPDSELVLNFMATFYGRMCEKYLTQIRDYDQGIEYCLSGMELEPAVFPFYYGITKYFDFQSRYNAEMIYDRLQRIADDNPQMLEYKWFQDYLNIYRDKQAWEAGVREWILSDLTKVVETCREQDVQVVIQNYPIDYPLANSALKELTETHSLPFVDNLSRFRDLEPKAEYIYDDDHCTSKGRRIMAQNVATTLFHEE